MTTARTSRSCGGGAATALGVVGTAPVWGSSRIAFLGPNGVATVAPSGAGNRRVSGLSGDRGAGLAWSPDDKRLALVADDSDGLGDVWTVNADGIGLTRTHPRPPAARSLALDDS